jgi:hypothetical protein
MRTISDLDFGTANAGPFGAAPLGLREANSGEIRRAGYLSTHAPSPTGRGVRADSATLIVTKQELPSIAGRRNGRHEELATPVYGRGRDEG